MTECQQSGIGNVNIDQICGVAFTARLAVRIPTVDAVNQAWVVRFYQRTGFIKSLSEKKERQCQMVRDTVLMFKNLFEVVIGFNAERLGLLRVPGRAL